MNDDRAGNRAAPAAGVLNTLSRVGLVGMVTTAAGNFTEVLEPLAAALGLAGSLPMVQAVMMGLFAFFIFIFLAGMFRTRARDQRREQGRED